MFVTILQKQALGYIFWTTAHRMIIFAFRFWGSKITITITGIISPDYYYYCYYYSWILQSLLLLLLLLVIVEQPWFKLDKIVFKYDIGWDLLKMLIDFSNVLFNFINIYIGAHLFFHS